MKRVLDKRNIIGCTGEYNCSLSFDGKRENYPYNNILTNPTMGCLAWSKNLEKSLLCQANRGIFTNVFRPNSESFFASLFGKQSIRPTWNPRFEEDRESQSRRGIPTHVFRQKKESFFASFFTKKEGGEIWLA